ncbi:hypothetical protein KSS87_019732, partial [Heliosperma pusillum]
ELETYFKSSSSAKWLDSTHPQTNKGPPFHVTPQLFLFQFIIQFISINKSIFPQFPQNVQLK